jgi:prepilin-type processing-associated H-X9-DG protein
MSQFGSQPPYPPQSPQPPYGGPPPYGQPGGYPGGQYGGPPQSAATSGWATASLILGILSFFVPFAGSLAAIITGAVGINKTGPGKAGGRGLAVAGLSMGIASILIGFVMVSIMLPALSKAREAANQIKCSANLRQIGNAVFTFANANNGKLPPALDSATLGSYLNGSVPVCPVDGQPYHYVKPTESNIAKIRDADMRVIAYDDPQHHDGKMIALFADGHTATLDKDTTARVLAKINAGEPATVSSN